MAPPRHLYSPHTTFLRQAGHSFDIATALCSLLIGLGYDAYVVSGYAIKDVTFKVMCRIECPFPQWKEEEPVPEPEEEDQKYKITPPKCLQSKFLAMMKQRELDAAKAEEEKRLEIEREQILEEEKRPFDELEGQRIHAWVYLAAGNRSVKESVFIEPSTGMSHPLDTVIYCGIESIWNNENYWVNLQDCSKGLGSLSYDFTLLSKWEHLLVGEPLQWRVHKAVEIGEEEEGHPDFWDEKHLDMPYPWSMKISIPHDEHVYFKNQDFVEAERTIFFNNKARFDGLSKIEIQNNVLSEHFCDREDKLYYRQVVYDEKRSTKEDSGDTSNRRPVLKIIQKYLRNEEKSPFDDLSIREFNIRSREINLKYHYGKGNVTASTRTFIKPPISEMGENMAFRPELTYGYQAQIGAKPPRQLQLFLLLEQQLKDEKEVLDNIRDSENQISEFLLLRAHEMAFSKLDVSMYNREQNQESRIAMLEQEEKQRMYKEKEVEEAIDYLSPYLARLGNPSSLTYDQALDIKHACLEEFKQLLLGRANAIQHSFERVSSKVEEMQAWYTQNHEDLTPEEEARYFEEVNELIFYLRTLEIRLSRHKDLSYSRYAEMTQYVENHPMLDVLTH